MIRLALGPVQAAYRALHWRRVPVVHVAGTNGKGSVCSMVEAVLAHAGLRTGLLTSPLLGGLGGVRDGRWCSVRIGGEELGTAALAAPLAKVDALHADLSPFERETVGALQAFEAAALDVAVLECGLGGANDATNVVGGHDKLVCVLTSVGMDHADWLGDSVVDIARNKLGIVRPGVPLVVDAMSSAPEVVTEAEAACESAGAPLHTVRSVHALAEFDTVVPLAGAHQRRNAAVAIEALLVIRERLPPELGARIDDACIRDGIRKTVLPGRLQWVNHKKMLLDGAHNPAAAAALREYLDAEGLLGGARFVVGIQSSKDAAGFAHALFDGAANRIVAVPIPGMEHLSLAPSSLRDTILASGYVGDADAVSVTESLQAALQQVENDGEEGLTVVCGSLHLVGGVVSGGAEKM